MNPPRKTHAWCVLISVFVSMFVQPVPQGAWAGDPLPSKASVRLRAYLTGRLNGAKRLPPEGFAWGVEARMMEGMGDQLVELNRAEPLLHEELEQFFAQAERSRAALQELHLEVTQAAVKLAGELQTQKNAKLFLKLQEQALVDRAQALVQRLGAVEQNQPLGTHPYRTSGRVSEETTRLMQDLRGFEIDLLALEELQDSETYRDHRFETWLDRREGLSVGAKVIALAALIAAFESFPLAYTNLLRGEVPGFASMLAVVGFVMAGVLGVTEPNEKQQKSKWNSLLGASWTRSTTRVTQALTKIIREDNDPEVRQAAAAFLTRLEVNTHAPEVRIARTPPVQVGPQAPPKAQAAPQVRVADSVAEATQPRVRVAEVRMEEFEADPEPEPAQEISPKFARQLRVEPNEQGRCLMKVLSNLPR